MKIAYLIDRESIGGGMEFIRVKRSLHRNVESRVFFSDKGECRMRTMRAWHADEIFVVHLKALLQLLWNPLVRPCSPVTFAVLGVHIRKYQYLPRTIGSRMKYLVRWGLERYLYGRCRKIVVQNKSDAEELERLYGCGGKVVVDTPSLGDWHPDANIVPSVKYDFVYIARFEFQKGQDRWIDYLARHADEFRAGKRVTLFVGTGGTLEFCKRDVRLRGIGDLVEFRNETTEIEICMLQADYVVSASRWEGYPFLLMKARALGCKILATDCPGNRDVLAGYDKWEKLEL